MMRSPGGGYALVCTPCLRYPVYYQRDRDTVRSWIGMIVPYRMPILPTGGMIIINATGIAWRYSTKSREDYGKNVCMYLQWGVQREPQYARLDCWFLFLFELWVQAGRRELSKRRNAHQLSMFMLNWEDDKSPRWSNKNYNWTISSSNVLL